VFGKKKVLSGFAAVFSVFVLAAAANAGVKQSHAGAVTSLLQAVNQTRAANGLRPLKVDAALTRAARSHSLEMLRGNYFAHGDFHGRMVAFHVSGPMAGENLAWGNGTYAQPSTIITEWLNSPEHRANLLHAGWTRIGIGITYGTFLGNAGAAVVTTDFAGS
jgi:uncharacterized protein YkwD